MSARPDVHNASVDPRASAAGACGLVDLRTGEVCLHPARHPGGCDFPHLVPRRSGELEQYPVGDILVVAPGTSSGDGKALTRLVHRIHRTWGTFTGVVVDLGGVGGLTRADEDALARLHREAPRHGGRVMLAGADRSTALATLRERVPDADVHASVADALAAAPGRRSPVLTRTLPLVRRPEAARDARAFVRTLAREWTIESDVADRTVDVCSELTANAVRHAKGGITETVEMDTRRVAVVVWDGSHRPPRVLPYRPGVSQTGLGLRIVQQLSGCWGFRTAAHGKFVWAVVPRPSATA